MVSIKCRAWMPVFAGLVAVVPAGAAKAQAAPQERAAPQAHATPQAPVEIGAVGPVVSTKPYFQLFRERAGPPQLPALENAVEDALEVLKGYWTQRAGKLPVHTANMTPGDVPTRSSDIPFLRQPVCLVGADSRSLRWLRSRRERLEEVHATCIVVEVADEDELRELVDALGDIPWFAASGADIARAHQLPHYPVLISRQYIEQ